MKKITAYINDNKLLNLLALLAEFGVEKESFADKTNDRDENKIIGQIVVVEPMTTGMTKIIIICPARYDEMIQSLILNNGAGEKNKQIWLYSSDLLT